MKFDWYIVVYIIVDILKIKVNVNWEVKVMRKIKVRKLWYSNIVFLIDLK